MNSLICPPLATSANRARPQLQDPVVWRTLHMPKVQIACSGNCDQGRRCNCALSSTSSCKRSDASSLASEEESRATAILLQMFMLLTSIMALGLLAWTMA